MADDIKFDPRDLIMRPFIPCPKCGKQELGIFAVGPDRFERRCRACGVAARYPLPKIAKTLIYLDQFAITNLMHVRTKSKQVDQFWHDAYAKLLHLSRLQLIVCPKSVAHFLESVVATSSDQLQTAAELFAHDVFFTDFETVRHGMVLKALDQWISGTGEPAAPIPRQAVLHGDPDVWNHRLRFTGTITPVPGYVPALEADRDTAFTGLLDMFENVWKKNPDKSWEHWFEQETAAYGREILKRFVGEQQKWLQIRAGKLTTANSFGWLPEPVLGLFFNIFCKLEAAAIAKEDQIRKTAEFMASDVLKAAPFIRISSSLYASIAMKAPAQQKQPTRGFFTDVDVISCLLPFCDAMFLDRECSGYWHEIQSSAKHRLPYDTQVFSLSSKAAFLSYLDQLETTASAEHRILVRQIYSYPREQEAAQPEGTKDLSVSPAAGVNG